MSDAAATTALNAIEPRPGVAKPDALLVVDGLRRRFGGILAVDVDHLEIQRGAITALIGPNGAGKTTLFNLVTGFDRAGDGRWTLDGQPIQHRRAHDVARAGMVRTFQLTRALARLSVLENVMLAAPTQRGEHLQSALLPRLWRSQERQVRARALELLGRFDLAHVSDDYAGTLSGGQRKLLEMARALMSDPRLLMLDEPVAGVNPALTESILVHINELPARGTTVLFVEHDMDVVMDVSDWVVVMAQGRVIAEGPPHVVVANPAVIDSYLGAHYGSDGGT